MPRCIKGGPQRVSWWAKKDDKLNEESFVKKTCTKIVKTQISYLERSIRVVEHTTFRILLRFPVVRGTIAKINNVRTQYDNVYTQYDNKYTRRTVTLYGKLLIYSSGAYTGRGRRKLQLFFWRPYAGKRNASREVCALYRTIHSSIEKYFDSSANVFNTRVSWRDRCGLLRPFC